MDLIIKCSSDCCTLDGSAPVLSWGFSVRRDHRVVHQASGVLNSGGRLAAGAVAVEAVRQALSWLLEQTVRPGSVRVRSTIFFEADLPLDDLLFLLCTAGWDVELQAVTPEYVSEATALAWSAVGPVLKSALKFASRKGRPVVLGSQAVQYAWDSDYESDLTVICDGGCRRIHGKNGLAVYGFLGGTGGSRLSAALADSECTFGHAGRAQVRLSLVSSDSDRAPHPGPARLGYASGRG